MIKAVFFVASVLIVVIAIVIIANWFNQQNLTEYLENETKKRSKKK